MLTPQTYADHPVKVGKFAVIIFDTTGRKIVGRVRKYRTRWQLTLPGYTWPVTMPHLPVPIGTPLPVKSFSTWKQAVRAAAARLKENHDA